jgi:outer membrane protein assembly factor BamB
MSRRIPRTAAVLALVAALAAPPARAGAQLWSRQIEQEINWHRVTHLGTLLVATDDSLRCLNPETGEPLWQRDDLKKVGEWNVEEVAGTPNLLVHVNLGTVQAKTSLHAVDIMTGQDRWQTEAIRGVTVDTFPVYDRGYVLVISTEAPAAKAKLELAALEMASGKTLWQASFEERADLHVAESSGKFLVKYDLSGHQPPLYDGESLYLSYAGIHRFDAATGQLVWKNVYDVTEGVIKRGNAQALIDGDTVFTSAKALIRAIDKATGQIRWTSKDFGGAVAQMELAGGVIYARMGGNFYDKMAKEWKLKKPLGVVAVDPKSGAEIWRYTGAKEGITNMVVLPEQKAVLIADQKNLIGLDMGSQGKVQEAFNVKVEFKDKIGAGKVAAGVGKFLLGGAKAAASGGAEQDSPVAIRLRKDGTAVVVGKQHLLAFDTAKRQIAWSIEYDPPGRAGWAKALAGAMTALTYAANVSQAAATGSSAYAGNASQSIADYSNYASKRYAAAGETDRYYYVLTNIAEGKEKGAGIVGVNLDTGKADRQVLFDEKEPQYEVDELTGRVFNVKNKNTLTGFSVR